MRTTAPGIAKFENAFAEALQLIQMARDSDKFACPEGQALLAHCEGRLRAHHARGRKLGAYAGIEALKAEIWKAVAQWHDYGELRPAGDPDFEALLRFYREG